MTIEKIRSLKQQKDKILKELLEEIQNTIPIGSIIEFERENGTIVAEILGHSDSRRL